MNFTNPDWPIQPSFLSICATAKKEYSFLDREQEEYTYSPNRDGIFNSDELRGFLADASDDYNINNPLSLFQVIPEKFDYERSEKRIEEIFPKDIFIQKIITGKRIIRIDPGNLYSNFHCCDLFRKCQNGENKYKCFESDSRIALLYEERLLKINYEKDFKKFYNTFELIISEYNKELNKYEEDKDYNLKVIPYENNRFYVKYRCKYSKLEEFFFPVIHSGKVVAVLMHGQRFPHDIKKDDIFSGYIENSNKGNKLRNSIRHLGKKYFNTVPMSEKRLTAITKRIEHLEKRINNEMNAAAQKYISVHFSNWEKEFRKNIKSIDSSSDSALMDYKKALNKILNNIFYTFNSEGFIRIYSLQSHLEDDNIKQDRFELIGDSTCNHDPRKYASLVFSPFSAKKDPVEKKELLEHIKSIPLGFDKSKDIFRMDVPFTSQKAYIVWKRYDDFNDPNHFTMYCTALKSMYHTLLEPYIILDGIKLEQKLEASMRISVHESAQVIPSVIDTINNEESLVILETGDKYNGTPNITLPIYKVLDASNRLLLLEGLFRRSTLIFKKDPPKNEWHDLHRIIYSTKSLFETKVYDQNYQSLQILSNRSFNKHTLLTDYGYVSHILFNLVDNAVKYGFKGSNIYIKVILENDLTIEKIFGKKDNICKIIISIISYGNEIQEEMYKKMFELYYRHASKEIEGMGIGLFLVKKLCNLMGYEIECKKSVKLSDVNLPLQYCYSEQNDLNDSTLDVRYLQTLRKSMSNEIKEEVVNPACKKSWEVTDEEIIGLLNKATFRNEFQITIPITMSKNLIIQ